MELFARFVVSPAGSSLGLPAGEYWAVPHEELARMQTRISELENQVTVWESETPLCPDRCPGCCYTEKEWSLLGPIARIRCSHPDHWGGPGASPETVREALAIREAGAGER